MSVKRIFSKLCNFPSFSQSEKLEIFQFYTSRPRKRYSVAFSTSSAPSSRDREGLCFMRSLLPHNRASRTQKKSSDNSTSATHLVLAVAVAAGGTASHCECWKLAKCTSCELGVGCRWVSRDRKGKRRENGRVTGLFDFQAAKWRSPKP